MGPLARAVLTLAATCLAALVPAQEAQQAQEAVRFEELPVLPEGRAVAGAFAGVSGGALLVAGGANFPDGRPWDGASKVWHDRVLVLQAPDAAWQELDIRLPRPSAYGVSLTYGDRVLCLGGGDAERHHADCFALRWDPSTGSLDVEPLPPLPEPVAFGCGVLLGDVVHVFGGSPTPDLATASGHAWSLDLRAAGRRWEALPDWPARPRILATAGAQDGSVFLFGGADLVPTAAGGPASRVPLRDAWRYHADGGWSAIADLPRPTIAAPSPALALGQAHLVILGGDDGSLSGQDLRDAHPGFLADVLAYHTSTDTWRTLATFPKDPGPDPAARPDQAHWPAVTTPTVRWDGSFVIPTGEIRPGVRTPRTYRIGFEHGEHPFALLDYAVLAAYLLALVAVGVFFASRESSTEDFFLGGRKIPWWAAGLSIFGTQLSAITFMAIPALVFRTDWVYFFGALTIALAAPVVVRAYLPHFKRFQVTTAYEILEHRFSLAVRLCASAAFLLFQVGRMGVLLYLPAMALSTVTGIDVFSCILVMGVLATLYTVLGGIEAVIWTDVLQVIVLLGGAITSLIVVLLSLDVPLADAFSDAMDTGKLRLAEPGWDAAATVLWVVVIGRFLENFVPYTSDQTVVQRYLTTRDEKQAARSIWTNAVLSVPASILFFAVGTALWTYYRTHPERLDVTGQHDEVFPWFVAQELPAGLSGLVIAALFAASMSSLDSSMNSMATAVTTDWVQRLRKRALDEVRALRLARGLTLLFGVVGTGSALWLAAIQTTSLWDQYTRIVGLFGGGLAGLFALAVFTRRVHATGALVGFVASAIVLILVAPHVHFFLFAGIGLLTCCAVAMLASLVLPAPRRLG